MLKCVVHLRMLWDECLSHRVNPACDVKVMSFRERTASISYPVILVIHVERTPVSFFFSFKCTKCAEAQAFVLKHISNLMTCMPGYVRINCPRHYWWEQTVISLCNFHSYCIKRSTMHFLSRKVPFYKIIHYYPVWRCQTLLM